VFTHLGWRQVDSVWSNMATASFTSVRNEADRVAIVIMAYGSWLE
jgi:hypothetical protein